MTAATATKFDVYGDYIVLSPDRDYKGISAKQEFLNGKANIEGLTKDATADQQEERLRHLEWFLNAGYVVEPAEFMRRKGTAV